MTYQLFVNLLKNMTVCVIYTNDQNNLSINHMKNFNLFLPLISLSPVSLCTSSQIFCHLKNGTTILLESSFIDSFRWLISFNVTSRSSLPNWQTCFLKRFSVFVDYYFSLYWITVQLSLFGFGQSYFIVSRWNRSYQ